MKVHVSTFPPPSEVTKPVPLSEVTKPGVWVSDRLFESTTPFYVIVLEGCRLWVANNQMWTIATNAQAPGYLFRLLRKGEHLGLTFYGEEN